MSTVVAEDVAKTLIKFAAACSQAKSWTLLERELIKELKRAERLGAMRARRETRTKQYYMSLEGGK
jgi:hypothetical protein